MSYKWLEKDIYDEFMSFITESIMKQFSYDYIYMEDYEDGKPYNHPDKIYYSCMCFYGYERDVFPVYKSELDAYFKEFKGLHRQLRIDKLFEI
jgi:hypothetical protein